MSRISRALAALLLLAPLGAFALAAGVGGAFAQTLRVPHVWHRVQDLFVLGDPARLYWPNAVYVMRGTTYDTPQLPGVWHRVDLRPFGVAEDARAAFLSGVLIITHGATEEIADLQVMFRKPGDTETPCSTVMGQTTETHVTGGQRSNMATWVPLHGGSFEFCYRLSTPAGLPTHSAYGINLSVQAWAR